MRKVHRKKEVDVTSSYLALFDTVSLEEWDIRLGEEVLSSRRDRLEAIFREKSFQFLRLVEQVECDKTDSEIDLYHRQFVKRGYEGAMVKNPGLPYSFGRSDAVIKVKSFFDVDLTVVGFKEGSGRHIGKLGSVLVDFEEVEVYVGSGFDDEMRDEVWKNQSVYLGMTAEVRYQEVTPDGSLRFPTFVCWRTDK
jgi:DNA ligase-1